MTETTLQSRQDQAVSLRYGQKAAPTVGPWSSVIDSLLSHRSVRRYKPDALEPGTLQTLVAAAQSAATSSNLQCWSVLSVSDPSLRAELAVIAGNQKHIEQCPLFLVWLCDLSRNRRLGEAEGVDLQALGLTESFVVGVVDAALAAQNAVIAAESLGLSTVYIGALRNDAEKVARLLNLPQGCFAVFGLCVGHADTQAEVKPRLPQQAILFENRYEIPDENTLRSEYDETLGEFSRRNEMAQATWTERVIDRTQKKSAVSGRVRLRSILESLGFPLR